MKKTTVKALAMALVFVCAAILSSCSCSRDKKDLLSFVPADTAGVAVIDLSQLWDQLEIKADGDDFSYCSELKEIVKLSGAKSKDLSKVEEVLKNFEGTAKTIVIFEYKDAVWGTFFVKDGDDFIKTLEDEGKADFDKEDGYKVWEAIAVKKDQVWFCVDFEDDEAGIDTEEIEKLADLDKDKRFDKKYEKIAEYMLGEDVSQAYCLNINKMMSCMGFSKYDIQRSNMVISMAFEDAEFLVGQSKLTDKGMTGEVRVLNEKQAPAKFLLPMAKIEASGLALLNNDAPLVGALAVNPELVQKIKGLVSQMYGGLSAGEEEEFNVMGSIANTSGFSFATANDCKAVVGFNDANMASIFGSDFLPSDFPFEVSVSGKSVLFRLPGTPEAGKGKAPSQLVGQYAGIILDFAKEGGKLISGYDLSKLGKMWLTLGPDGNGVKLAFTWELKNPVRTLLKEALAIYKGVVDGSISAPGFQEFEDKNIGLFARRDVVATPDTTYMYDDYDYYEEVEAPVAAAEAPAEEYAM